MRGPGRRRGRPSHGGAAPARCSPLGSKASWVIPLTPESRTSNGSPAGSSVRPSKTNTSLPGAREGAVRLLQRVVGEPYGQPFAVRTEGNGGDRAPVLVPGLPLAELRSGVAVEQPGAPPAGANRDPAAIRRAGDGEDRRGAGTPAGVVREKDRIEHVAGLGVPDRDPVAEDVVRVTGGADLQVEQLRRRVDILDRLVEAPEDRAGARPRPSAPPFRRGSRSRPAFPSGQPRPLPSRRPAPRGPRGAGPRAGSRSRCRRRFRPRARARWARRPTRSHLRTRTAQGAVHPWRGRGPSPPTCGSSTLRCGEPGSGWRARPPRPGSGRPLLTATRSP